jgi:hypothetical protein
MILEYATTFTLLTIYTMVRHFWTDIHELKIDSRRNYMMIGAVLTIALISHQATTLIIAGLLTIVITLILGYFEKKQGKIVFGAGDKEILTWTIPGIAVVFGYSLAGIFIGLIALGFFVLAFLRYKLFITEKRVPGLILLCLAYMIILIIGWMLL